MLYRYTIQACYINTLYMNVILTGCTSVLYRHFIEVTVFPGVSLPRHACFKAPLIPSFHGDISAEANSAVNLFYFTSNTEYPLYYFSLKLFLLCKSLIGSLLNCAIQCRLQLFPPFVTFPHANVTRCGYKN